MKLKYILLLTGAMLILTGCNKHEHTYTTEKIEPTCTTVGYDVYTCECGHSYNEQLEILEHTYTTKESEDFCRTIYTCTCGDTYEEDSYEVVSCDPFVCYAAGDIVTYNGPSEFYGVNEKTFAFNDEVTVTGTFNNFTEIDIDGIKLYIAKDQLMEEKYVEPEVQTAAKPVTPTKPQTQSNPNSIRDALLSRPGATITTEESNAANFGGYTSQEETEALSHGQYADVVWQ